MPYYLERCREELLNYDRARLFEESTSKSEIVIGRRCAARGRTKYRWWLFSPRTPAYTTGLAANLVLKKIGRRPQPRYLSTRPSAGRVQRWRCNVELLGETDRFSFFFFAAEKAPIRLVVPCRARLNGTKRKLSRVNEFLARVSSHENRWLRQRSATVVLQSPERPNRRLSGESSEGSFVLIPRYRAAPFGSRTYIDLRCCSFARYLS